MLSRTSSHMCGTWYLPTFLLRDGLLTLMYRASFIALLRGAVTYPTSKELSRILKPLVGKSPYHICNNHDFIEDLKAIKLGPEEVMVSCDVKALFTSVPVKPALKIIEKLLKEDQDLQKITSMSIPNIMDLLEFCLRSTYFTYRGKFYEQVQGACHGLAHQPNCGKPLHGAF